MQSQDRDRQDRERQYARSSGRQDRRIPEDRFRGSFGREHTFQQRSRSEGGGVRGGEGQRFQYGGYWFEYAEARPYNWSYDDDDYYIDYIDDDCYLHDLRHPGVRVLVFIVE